MAISPISIYMGLAMTTLAAENDAQTELANLLGISNEDIVKYTKYLYTQLNREGYNKNKLMHKIQLSNSLWLNDNLSYKEEGLELLKDTFYADSYAVPFTTNNNIANKAIHDYVFRNTKGLINNQYNFDTETFFLLINTLYLKDTWDSFGTKLLKTRDIYTFKNNNNTTKQMQLLSGDYVNGKVQQGDGFEYFYTETSNHLKLYFIKPTTKKLNEIYNKENLNTVLNDKEFDINNEELKESYWTRCFFPEFNATFNEDMVELLKEEYGISKIFREDTANFDKITDEPCDTRSIIHQTTLIVDEVGIEGAAVMATAGGGAGFGGYDPIYYDFIIDKAFGFMITVDNTILFSGVINNL